VWEEEDENVKTVGASGLSQMQSTEPYNMASPWFDIYKVLLSLCQNATTYIFVA
jgi:hypothetical protein